MLTGFGVQDFKSIKKAWLPLSELTVLIGANASGKSNLIEALQILSWMARGQRLGDLHYATKEGQLDSRGAPAGLFRHDGNSFVLECRLGARPDLHQDSMRFSVKVQRRGEEIGVVEESLSAPELSGVPMYEVAWPADEHGHDLHVVYNNFARGGRKPRIVCTSQQAVFTQLATPARFGANHKMSQRLIPRYVGQLREALEGVLFLDPAPRHMRDYSFTAEKKLRSDGGNVSAVLHALCEDERKDDVLEFVRALPEQDILDVSFLNGPRGEVMVQLAESFGGESRSYEAALLSDGTLRILAVAAALLSVPVGTLVVIEEIDNGVHPTRAKLLLDNIQRVARERCLSVLLTTHNPALLDAIPVDAIPDVVACYRDPHEGDSRLMPLRNLEDYPELVAQGPVGELVTRGILERYVKSPKSPEQKAEEARQVLEMLQLPLEEA